MPGSRSQQDQKPTAKIKVGRDLSRASLGELQQELQVRIKDLQSRREALVRELQEVDEQLLAHTGGPGGGHSTRWTKVRADRTHPTPALPLPASCVLTC